MKRLQALRDLVTLHLETASDRQERYYNKRHREVVYEIGDRVMRRQHVLSSAANFVPSKLAPKNKDPYTVIRVLSKVVYEVTDSEGRVDKVHVKDLKPYYEQGFPNVEVLSDDYRSDAEEGAQIPPRNGAGSPSPGRATRPEPTPSPTRKTVGAREGSSVGAEADPVPTNIQGGKEEGVGLEGHKPEDHKWSFLPEKGGGPKDDVESSEGRHRRRCRRSKKTQEVQALSALKEAVGSESKGAIPKELPRRREKEDPFPRVEEETLAKLRELRFPRKEGDTWEQSPFWKKGTNREAVEKPRAEPGREFAMRKRRGRRLLQGSDISIP